MQPTAVICWGLKARQSQPSVERVLNTVWQLAAGSTPTGAHNTIALEPRLPMGVGAGQIHTFPDGFEPTLFLWLEPH